MTTQPTLDRKKLGVFLGKVLADTSGMMVTIMAHIGDHLGLFQQLALGPATSTQLAARAHISERYAGEWLYLMASAGYVIYDPANHSFTLPPEHIPVLAQELTFRLKELSRTLLRTPAKFGMDRRWHRF